MQWEWSRYSWKKYECEYPDMSKLNVLSQRFLDYQDADGKNQSNALESLICSVRRNGNWLRIWWKKWTVYFRRKKNLKLRKKIVTDCSFWRSRIPKRHDWTKLFLKFFGYRETRIAKNFLLETSKVTFLWKVLYIFFGFPEQSPFFILFGSVFQLRRKKRSLMKEVLNQIDWILSKRTCSVLLYSIKSLNTIFHMVYLTNCSANYLQICKTTSAGHVQYKLKGKNFPTELTFRIEKHFQRKFFFYFFIFIVTWNEYERL